MDTRRGIRKIRSMKRFKLIEHEPSVPKRDNSKRLFYSKIDDDCWRLDFYKEWMIGFGFASIELTLAERLTGTDIFFCRCHNGIGDKGESCGRLCKGYDPKNGKSGACKHVGFVYEETGKKFTLKRV